MKSSFKSESDYFLGKGPNPNAPMSAPTKFRNKIESDEFILRSGMNYTPFHLVRNMAQVLDVLEGIQARKAEPVSIRFKGKGMQPFKPNLSTPQAFVFCEAHFAKDQTPLGIYEATEGYDDFRTWNGEIQLLPDGTLNAHYHPRSKGLKMRDALASPESMHAVRVPWDFRPLRWAVDYLCRFGVDLIGPVVELSAFSRPVGVKSENIVVWEVRNF